MRSREESIAAFCESIDELKNKKYLFASTGMFSVTGAINSSKILTEIFEYFTEDMNLYEMFQESFIIENGVKYFKMPEKTTDAIGFIYLLMREINYKNIIFTDLLDYFTGGNNYDVAYNSFYETVLVPFKNYTCSIVNKMIDGMTDTADEISLNNACIESLDASEVDVTIDDIRPLQNTTTLLHLTDLDMLAINQSRLSPEDKAEAIYVLNTFITALKGEDKDKIKLSFMAYMYCMKYYKKVKTNVERITKILYENGIL